MTDLHRHHRQHHRGLLHWPARVGLMLLALGVIALPFYAATEYYLNQKYVSVQVAAPTVQVDSAETAAWSGQARALPATSAPVVLAYHDIGYSYSPYTVTPEAFDEQLTALQQAGYRSLTSDEFVAYLKGEPAPPRSVYITFDDGPNGLWVYGDRILAHHQMHGTVFLITGRVDQRPYYLSWREIERMSASGRWDFQDHSHDLHRRSAIDPKGDLGSALANRLWLPGLQRLETPEEYATRVEDDLKQSFTDFTDHGLPLPQVFAFPFSEATDRANVPSKDTTLQTILHKYFVAEMTNVSSRALPASRRAAAAQTIQRLEVLKGSTPGALVNKVVRWTQVPPQDPAPLRETDLWTRNDALRVGGLGPFTGKGPYPSDPTVRYMAADFRSQSSVDWTDYEVDAQLAGLGDGTNQAAVQVRDESAAVVQVSVSQTSLTVMVNNRKTVVKALPGAATHALRVTVHGDVTTAEVDGKVKAQVTTPGDPGTLTGGISIHVGINHPHASWARFTSLRVIGGAAAQPGSPVGALPVTSAALFGPGTQWFSSPGVAADFRVGHDALYPQGRTLSVYGAFQPARTAGWTDYTVAATVTHLTTPQVSGALWVRVDSALAISVQVSRTGVSVNSGNADNQTLVGSRTLPDASSHRVSVTVTPTSTVIVVDGTVRIDLLAAGETGGVGFSAYRDLTRHSWPVLQNVTVTPVARS